MSSDHCFLAYCNYAATGEGVTILIAIGGSANHAERLFKARADEYFHQRIVIARMDESDEQYQQIARMIPPSVLNLFEENPPGTTQYYSELHFNLS